MGFPPGIQNPMMGMGAQNWTPEQQQFMLQQMMW
jgi:hypothetical protein